GWNSQRNARRLRKCGTTPSGNLNSYSLRSPQRVERSRRVALSRTGHASGPAATPPALTAGNGDHLDAVFAQHGVGGDVPLVAEDDPRGDSQVVGSVVPLLRARPLECPRRGRHGDLWGLQQLGQRHPQVVVAGDRQPTGPSVMVQLQLEVLDGVLRTHRDRTCAISNLGALRPQRDYWPWYLRMSARILDTEARRSDAFHQSCRRR